MGEAKRRGTYEQRRDAAIAAQKNIEQHTLPHEQIFMNRRYTIALIWALEMAQRRMPWLTKS